MPDPVAVAVARAALIAMGYPDAAARVRGTASGIPTLGDQHDVPKQCVVRAFCAGHVAAGHQAHVGGWPARIECADCYRGDSPSP